MSCWEDAGTLRDVDADRALARKLADDERRLLEQVLREFAEETIGYRVKQLRKKMRLSAEEFGHLLGVTPAAVWNYESGYSKPRKNALEKFELLERALGKKAA